MPQLLRRSSLRHRAIVAVAAPVLALAACQAKDTPAAGSGVRETAESGGEVTRSWNPTTLTAVQGVPIATLRPAIQQRLAGERPAGLGDDHWAHTKRLYKRYAQSPLWLNEDGLIGPRVEALTQAMLAADSDALDLSEYPFAELTQALQALQQSGSQATAAQVAEADVLLTAAYAALGEDLLVGQVSPSSVKQNWHIDPRDESIDGLLERGLAVDALDQSIAAMRPQSEDYEGLRKSLARYRQIATSGGWGTVPAGKALKPGQRDDPARLEALRGRLRAEGYDVGAAPTS